MGRENVFLNRPIQSDEEDWIGISTYVDTLDNAVEAGAKIIAVTSDFGTGKSSLLSLYRNKYSNTKKKIVNINLWGTYVHQADEKELLPVELHKSFIYQTINQLHHPISGKSSYISKRLSKDYGIISISGTNHFQVFFTVVAIAIGLGGALILRFKELVAAFLNISKSSVNDMVMLLLLAAFIIMVLILVSSEFVFSSKKSEGKRNLDENILIDLFRREVLNRGRDKHYIFVIEDLDRTDNKDTVFLFLKELRKYYISEGCKNKITFIVCIKPEAMLLDDIGEEEPKEYKKIFDYILNLQRINIDNYDAILNGLLVEKRQWLVELGLVEDECTENQIIEIKGMQWMIRGRNVDIREIKNRLNASLSLYENLCHRFSHEKTRTVITFEKCAVATYLRSEYEKEFYQLQDKDLDRLISQYVIYGHNEMDDAYQPKHWDDFSEKFRTELWMLISNKLIDANYRVYFYNYPTESKLYNLSEMKIYNSIVYQEAPTDTTEYEQYLKDSAEAVIYDAFQKITLLRVCVPRFVVEYDALFCVLINHFDEKFYELIRSLKIDEKSFPGDCELILTCVREREGQYNRKKLITELAAQLNDMFIDTSLLSEMRERLCREIPDQVLNFKILFEEGNAFISTAEVEAIGELDRILGVINYDLMKNSSESLGKIHELIMQQKSWHPSYVTFYEKVVAEEGLEEWKERLLQVCEHFGEIPDSFANIYDDGVLNGEVLLAEYVKLIESVPSVSDNVLKPLVEYQWVQGLPKAICKQLFHMGQMLLYICNESLSPQPEIDFDSVEVRDTIKENGEWISENAKESFARIRKIILQNHQWISDYMFLFCVPYSYLAMDEVNLIEDCRDFLKILHNWRMSENSGIEAVNYFNTKSRTTTETYEFVCYIAKQISQVAEKMFYELNLSKLPYRRMARARIREMNDKFYGLFDMEDHPQEKVKFLSFVGLSDEKIEKDLYEDLQEDEELRKHYVEYANGLDKVGKTTINNIVHLPTTMVYSEVINDKLYQNGYYELYVSSKTALAGRFEVEEERRDILWPIYVSVYHSPNRKRTRDYMSLNENFLQELIFRKEYEKAGDALAYYGAAEQTKELLEYVFEHLPEESIGEYLQKIPGFKNREAAHFCLEKLKEMTSVAADDRVYHHLKGKFVEPGLEGWHTKIWKRAIRDSH